MTVRFDTWVEADTPREAWEKLRLALEDKRMGDKLKNEFTVTILEDGAEDKANIKGELTVREVMDYCNEHRDIPTNMSSCECPMWLYGCNFNRTLPKYWDIEKITKIIRGYKPEGGTTTR